jgi:hypothetical protein
MKGSIFWDIIPRSPPSQPILQKNMLPPSSGSKTVLPALRWFLAWLILQPWWWRWHFPPKHCSTFNRLHGVTSQKTDLFTATAVKTSNPTKHKTVHDVTMYKKCNLHMAESKSLWIFSTATKWCSTCVFMPKHSCICSKGLGIDTV